MRRSSILGLMLGLSLAVLPLGWPTTRAQEPTGGPETSRPAESPEVTRPPASPVADACFDYNGPRLPGRSRPWLRPLTLGMLPGLPAGLDADACMPGFFLYDNVFKEDLVAWFVLPGIALGPDGCPLDLRDVYRRLFALHPMMGGQPPRRLTESEKESMEWDGDGTECFSEAALGVPLASAPPWVSVDALLGWYGALNLVCLAPVPPRIAAGGDSLAAVACPAATPTPTASPAPSASPTPSPAPSAETRHYRVVVNGQESRIPDQYWKRRGDERKGVRFDFRLVGEFTLTRTGVSKPWKVTSERVVTAEVTPSSLYPDRYTLTLTCPKCERLARDTRLYARIEGDEVVIGWRPFTLDVHATGTCAGCPSPVDSWFESDFWQRITGMRLPIEDLATTPMTRVTNASGDEVFAFAYGLERRP